GRACSGRNHEGRWWSAGVRAVASSEHRASVRRPEASRRRTSVAPAQGPRPGAARLVGGALRGAARRALLRSLTGAGGAGCERSGAEWNRTPDPFHAMEVLYQLSYSPEGMATIPATVAPSRPGTLART